MGAVCVYDKLFASVGMCVVGCGYDKIFIDEFGLFFFAFSG